MASNFVVYRADPYPQLGDDKLIAHLGLGSSCPLGTFTEVLLDQLPASPTLEEM